MPTKKFRFWDEVEQHMYTWEEIKDIWKISQLNNTDLHKAMQFTGYLDKNGKEVYEGDILSSVTHGGKPVQWNETLLQWTTFGGPDLWAYRKDSEVIGNIYQNPELLNE